MGAVVLAAETVESTISLVTTLAARTIPGATGAGVTLVDDRGTRTVAATDPLVEQADAMQYATESGPCLTAWRDQVTVRADDLHTETRWPQWSADAAALGIRSFLSVPLTAVSPLGAEAAAPLATSVGAIKVYSTRPGAYDAHAEDILTLFARQAAVLLANTQTLADARRLSADLRHALASRDVIGQAKGVLLAQGAPDEQTAFAMLVSASQRSHTKLHDVARQLVASVMERQPRWRTPTSTSTSTSTSS